MRLEMGGEGEEGGERRRGRRERGEIKVIY